MNACKRDGRSLSQPQAHEATSFLPRRRGSAMSSAQSSRDCMQGFRVHKVSFSSSAGKCTEGLGNDTSVHDVNTRSLGPCY